MEKHSITSKEHAYSIVEWIKDYAISNKIESLVVGVSGGVDSALVSILCAMTGLKTYAISMPIRQREDQRSLASVHLNTLQTSFENVIMTEINLDKVMSQFEHDMVNNVSCLKFDSQLGFSNSRARLRMTTLYQIAASVNGIVIGTGNKVEDFGIGFFTKYGDGGVDISPIGDMTKTEVWEMAKELGVNFQIVEAKPTDGLWEDYRTDEDQIGATYKELEWAMNYIHDNKQTELSEREHTVLAIYYKYHNNNIHKFVPIPVFHL